MSARVSQIPLSPVRSIALTETASAAIARASSTLQRLRAFRHYVCLMDVGYWGANYLLFFEDQAEPTRAKIVIVDDGPCLRIHWLWSEVGNTSLPLSNVCTSARPAHLACIAQNLPAGAILSSAIFLGWYREVTFEEVVPQDAPSAVDSTRNVLVTIGRLPVTRSLDGVTACIRHEPPFWESESRHTRLGRLLEVLDPAYDLDGEPYWVELPLLRPAHGSSILHAALNWASCHPHLSRGTLDALLGAVHGRLTGKPAPSLDVLHASDPSSLLPLGFAQRLSVALLARVELENKSLVRRLVVALDVNQLPFGARGRTTLVIAGIPVSVELTAPPILPSAEGTGCRTLTFSLELTVCVAYVTSTQRISMVGEFLIDGDRVAICAMRQRGGASMQSFYSCSDPARTPSVECAIASVRTALG